jgi:hypothetical protein
MAYSIDGDGKVNSRVFPIQKGRDKKKDRGFFVHINLVYYGLRQSVI